MRKESAYTEVMKTRSNTAYMERTRREFKHAYTLLDMEHDLVIRLDVVGGPWRYDEFINGTKSKGRKQQWRNCNIFENLRIEGTRRLIMYDAAEAFYNYQKLEFNPNTNSYEVTRIYCTDDDNNIDMKATVEMENFINEQLSLAE